MSDKVPVKTVTAVLHAREDVQQASCGDSEEPSGGCGVQKCGANWLLMRSWCW